MSAHVIEANTESFEKQVLEASKTRPVLVDFWAPWCGPCRALTPVLEKLAAEYRGRFVLAKVNSDGNAALAQKYGVRSIPNVKLFVNAKLVDEFVGALPESAAREFIDRHLPSAAEPLREQALAAKARGDSAAARSQLLKAIAVDPRHEAARLDLAELLLDVGDLDEARRVLEEIADRVRDSQRLNALRARLQLSATAPAGTTPSELEARVAADPDDLEARYELASLLVKEKAYRPAMEQLLEIVRRDRKFRDDIGRTTLIQIFNLLGTDHDLVREFRGELAQVLNR